MTLIEEGLQAATTQEYVFGIVETILTLFILGTICRCIMIAWKGITDGKNLSEVVYVIRNRIVAAIFAASISGFLNVVEGAFK